MSTPTYTTGNPYFDEAAFSSLQKKVSRNNVNPESGTLATELDPDELSELYASNIVNKKPKDLKSTSNDDLDDLKTDYSNLDEFTGWNPNLVEQVSTNYFEDERRKRKQQKDIGSSIKRAARTESFTDEYEEEGAVEKFFNFIDSIIKNLSEMADEAFAKINPFSNWVTEKPKATKISPPAPATQPALFIREAFKPKRSPHLWKSDPKPWWHLAFGSETNNKVVENLIKYQNETITADA